MSFDSGDVVSVNGSSQTGNCSSPYTSGDRIICEINNLKQSVLFDGIIPHLDISSSNTWASQLFVLQPFTSSGTELFLEWLNGPTNLSRIEMVVFNCPEWGIAVESIRFFSLGSGVVASIAPTATSCNSLVTVCISVPNRMYSATQLQLVLVPDSQWLSIAEVRLFTDGDCPSQPGTDTPTSMPTKNGELRNQIRIIHSSRLLSMTVRWVVN